MRLSLWMTALQMIQLPLSKNDRIKSGIFIKTTEDVRQRETEASRNLMEIGWLFLIMMMCGAGYYGLKLWQPQQASPSHAPGQASSSEEPLPIVEILNLSSDATAQQNELCERFAKAIDLFVSAEWKLASSEFKSILKDFLRKGYC